MCASPSRSMSVIILGQWYYPITSLAQNHNFSAECVVCSLCILHMRRGAPVREVLADGRMIRTWPRKEADLHTAPPNFDWFRELLDYCNTYSSVHTVEVIIDIRPKLNFQKHGTITLQVVREDSESIEVTSARVFDSRVPDAQWAVDSRLGGLPSMSGADEVRYDPLIADDPSAASPLLRLVR